MASGIFQEGLIVTATTLAPNIGVGDDGFPAIMFEVNTGTPSRTARSVVSAEFTSICLLANACENQRQRSIFAAIWLARIEAGTFRVSSVALLSDPGTS